MEFATMRILSRIGSIPPVPWIQNAYQAMLIFGSISLNVAASLAALLGLLFVYGISRSKTKSRWLGYPFLVLILTMLVAFVEPSPLLSLIFSSLAILVVSTLAVHLRMWRQSILLRLTQLLLIIAVGSSFYFKLVPQLEYLSGRSMAFARPFEIYLIGETATLLATAMIAFGYLTHSSEHAISKKALAYSSIVTGVFVLFFITSSWLVSIIAMWTLGFTMFLPIPIYAIVLFLFTYTVTASWSRHQPWTATGLMLLFFAGRLAQLGYLSLLMMNGLAILSFPEIFGLQNDKIKQTLSAHSPLQVNTRVSLHFKSRNPSEARPTSHVA